MRIAVVHSFYSAAQPSGENSVVADQVAELRSAGHHVELLARHTDDYSRGANYTARAAMIAVSGFGPSPTRELAEFNPDIVHLHNTFPNWGTKWLSQWGARTVMTLHNYRPLCANGLLFRDGHACHDCLRLPAVPAIRHRCYRESRAATAPLGIASSPIGALRRTPLRVAELIALNSDSVRIFEQYLGRTPRVIPNFVPTPTIDGPPLTSGWLYIGRLTRDKGVDRMIAAWPESESLDLIGDGPLAPQIGLLSQQNPRIQLLGLLPREEVLRRIPHYDGLILPSMAPEQLPTVVLEALAHGVPCILSMHVTAGAALGREGAAVQFDPSGDSGHLASRLMAVREARGDMSNAAFRVFGAQYSPKAWRNRIESLYAEVIARTT